MIKEILKITFFSIVEGITEWLPISSTGHLIILNEIIPLKLNKNIFDLFLIIIQLGAVLAVISTFYKKISPIKIKKTIKIEIEYTRVNLWIKMFISCLPVTIVALLLEEIINKYLYNAKTVCIALITVGFVFIFIDRFRDKSKKTKLADLSYKDSFIIGLFQSLSAIFPGVSRSASTMITANVLGYSKEISTEYSFYLSIPIMLGASIFKIIKFFIKGCYVNLTEVFILLYAMLIAYTISVFVIKFFINFVKKHGYKSFGFYRIFLGFLLLLFI